MHIILTVDNNWGIRFNNRRQSRDKIVTQRILEIASSSHLWISESSQKLFYETPPYLIIDNDFPSKADTRDYCFVEDMSLLPAEEKIEDIIIFHWNRSYPFDQLFDRVFLEQKWRLAENSEFVGHSHEKITEARYVRC